jgi:glyoxylase-like metal-dependent hydrolase (beta-lactamase superfamily II)
MTALHIGDAEIERVVEWVGPIKTVDEMFPDTPADAWDEITTDHWEPSTRAYRAAVQTWVLRSGGKTILVDTGVGNDRNRPQMPTFDHLHTDFLDRLARVGVEPQDVDIVVNTHIHYDHVGWNTRQGETGWEPTFPNAIYLVPEPDFDYFRPENAARMRPPRTEHEKARFAGIRLVFVDSIAPLVDSGQLRTWSSEHRIDGNLRLEPAPGHTPGSSVLWLESGDGAVFVGDLVHTPVQISRPDDACAFDIDAQGARHSRNDVLSAAAKRRLMVFPAHFAGHGGTTIAPGRRHPFEVDGWAEFNEV